MITTFSDKAKMSPTDNFLKTSDCELEPANKYPGRKHRRNPTGSEFEFK